MGPGPGGFDRIRSRRIWSQELQSSGCAGVSAGLWMLKKAAAAARCGCDGGLSDGWRRAVFRWKNVVLEI